MSLTEAERFWAKVDKAIDCWNWTAAKLPKGYGRFGVGHSVILAHRWAYEAAHGPIPDGLHIDHICFNKSCVRPSHLRAVTPKQNIENRQGANRNSRSGVRGVRRSGSGYQARVKHNRVEHYLGTFPTVAAAERAVTQARGRLYANV